MTLQRDSWAVQGADSSAQIARLMLTSATRSGNGIVGTGDLQVSQMTVPGSQVRIAAGAAVLLGQEQQWQGSYYAHNIGEDAAPISPTGSDGGRVDMVVLRVEDPSIDGTPWTHDPTADPVYYFRVIEDVGVNQSEPPSGMTAVPLARIHVPSNTATITSDMIVDLRVPANPRSERVLRVQRGGTQSDGESWDEAGNITSEDDPPYERWPQHDWSLTIPSWATQVQILADWSNVFLESTGDDSGTQDARGELFVGLVGGPDGPLYTTSSTYNFNQTSPTNGYRCSASNKDQIDIPPEWRGLTVDVRMYVSGTPGQDGRLVADQWANFSCDMEFLQVAAPEAEL